MMRPKPKSYITFKKFIWVQWFLFLQLVSTHYWRNGTNLTDETHSIYIRWVCRTCIYALIKLAKQFNSKCIDFVTDRYPEVKKKGSRTEALVPTGMQTIKIVGSNQKTPKQMKRFLALGSNKESLIEFFFQFLKTLNSNYFEDFTVLVVHGFKCYCLYGN